MDFELHQGKADPQGNADSRAEKWHGLWRVDQKLVPLKWDPAVELPCKFVLQDVHATRRLAKKYKEKTALGMGWTHPRHFAVLSDASPCHFLVYCRSNWRGS